MDVQEHLRNSLRAALAKPASTATTTSPFERLYRDHGDWSSNIALATAKKAGKNPRELGQALVDFLIAPTGHVTAVEIAGPGFVNFRLADTWLAGHDRRARAGCRWIRLTGSRCRSPPQRRVRLNPNKPLHAGRGRGACYGDSIAVSRNDAVFVSPVRSSMTAACR